MTLFLKRLSLNNLFILHCVVYGEIKNLIDHSLFFTFSACKVYVINHPNFILTEMMPKISIVLPFKNASRFIAETLASIQSQKFEDWEIIAVNDHSIDSTEKTLNWFAKNDDRVKIFQNPSHGIIPALEQALNEATGKFITRMDADDLMPPDRLGVMLEAIQHSPAKTIVTGLVNYFSETEAISDGYKTYEKWLNEINLQGTQWQNVYRECVVASPNWMMRTEELRECGGFHGLQYPEDYHLVFRWYRNNFKIHCIPAVTLLWREHPERTSRNSDHYSQRSFFQLKVSEFIAHERLSTNLVLWGTNIKGRLAADILTNADIPFRWMDLDSKKRINGIPISSYTKLEKIESPHVLVAVYPEEKERKQLEDYLSQLGLEQGKQWWYL